MIIIVGPPGTGKTPLCAKIAAAYVKKTGKPAVMVSKIPKAVHPFKRIEAISTAALNAWENALLVFDDSLDTIGDDERLQIKLRQRDAMRHHDKALYVVVYHSFADIPSVIKRSAHAVWAVKTNEAPQAGYTALLRRACEGATNEWQLFT